MPSSTAVLGTRKRKPAQRKDEETTDAAAALDDAQAIFRRHFEAQFAPIDGDSASTSKAAKKSKRPANGDDDEDDKEEDGVEDMRSDSESSEDDGEWGGVSGEEGRRLAAHSNDNTMWYTRKTIVLTCHRR